MTSPKSTTRREPGRKQGANPGVSSPRLGAQNPAAGPLRISANFDAGSIEVVSAVDAQDVRLNLRSDCAAEFRQWFFFRVQGAGGAVLRMRFLNAGLSAYPDGWEGYRAAASYDRRHWFRVPDTWYDGHVLTVECTPERDSLYFAYFEPYSHERHLDLLGRLGADPLVRVSDLGSTVQGRDINLVTVGEPAPEKKNVWVIARQHPGETMAEWFAEGMLDRLLDRSDPTARQLLDRACLHVVPNMNPDGTVAGNLRTNAAGANLNREWLDPSPRRSPEVWHVRNRMHETGVDLFLDIHGDEALPYVFADGCSMLPGFTLGQARRERRFLDALLEASPDFQTEHGYAPDRFTDEVLTLASKYVSHSFGCLSFTIEMPFKDNADLPDEANGWNGERSRRLGAAILQAMLAHLLEEPA
jgi:murein tripeptide amidase MpaA